MTAFATTLFYGWMGEASCHLSASGTMRTYRRCVKISFTCCCVFSSDPLLSITKSEREIFSLSGIWLASRRRASCSRSLSFSVCICVPAERRSMKRWIFTSSGALTSTMRSKRSRHQGTLPESPASPLASKIRADSTMAIAFGSRANRSSIHASCAAITGGWTMRFSSSSLP